MKVEHEAKLDRNEMSMLIWMCGFNLKDNKGTVGIGPGQPGRLNVVIGSIIVD